MIVRTLEEVLAYEAIRQLAHRYALAVDSRDIDALVGLFAEDVRVAGRTGREGLRQVFEEYLLGMGVTVLNVGTHVVDLVDADNATGWCYTHSQLQYGDRWIVQAVLYRDRYVRQAGEWYFARQRKHYLWYGAPVGVNPLTLPPAQWPARPDGLGDASEAAFGTWSQFRSRGANPGS